MTATLSGSGEPGDERDVSGSEKVVGVECLLVSEIEWMLIACGVFGGIDREVDVASAWMFDVSVPVCVSVAKGKVSKREILVCAIVLPVSGCGGSGVVGVERVAWWTKFSVGGRRFARLDGL